MHRNISELQHLHGNADIVTRHRVLSGLYAYTDAMAALMRTLSIYAGAWPRAPLTGLPILAGSQKPA